MLFIEIGQVFVEIWEGKETPFWCLGRAKVMSFCDPTTRYTKVLHTNRIHYYYCTQKIVGFQLVGIIGGVNCSEWPQTVHVYSQLVVVGRPQTVHMYSQFVVVGWPCVSSAPRSCALANR